MEMLCSADGDVANNAKNGTHTNEDEVSAEQLVWNSYNHLMMSPDVERLRKVLAREELFRRTIDIPGDIVECGVFKGTGLAQLSKFKSIFCPGSPKAMVGFDLFGKSPVGASDFDNAQMKNYFQVCGVDTLDLLATRSMMSAIDGGRTEVKLIAGDVRFTCKNFVDQNPGFKISFLNLDLDLEEPTMKALEALWPRVSVGGVVVFDEYAISRWSESRAVDNFFAELGEKVELKCLPWARTPSAYLIKC